MVTIMSEERYIDVKLIIEKCKMWWIINSAWGYLRRFCIWGNKRSKFEDWVGFLKNNEQRISTYI